MLSKCHVEESRGCEQMSIESFMLQNLTTVLKTLQLFTQAPSSLSFSPTSLLPPQLEMHFLYKGRRQLRCAFETHIPSHTDGPIAMMTRSCNIERCHYVIYILFSLRMRAASAHTPTYSECNFQILLNEILPLLAPACLRRLDCLLACH